MSDPIERPKTARGLKIALALSLSLNLLVIGLIGGAVLGRDGPPGRDEPPALRTLGLGPFALTLGQDGRDAVRDRLARDHDALLSERRAIGESLRTFQRALRADPFDRAAAAEAMARSRAAAEALQRYGHVAVLDYLDTLPLAERSELADALGRAMRRIEGRTRDRDGDR